MNQNVFVKIKWVEDNEVLKFQRISAKHLNVKNKINVCSTYCLIHYKIQMVFMIILQKLLHCAFFINPIIFHVQSINLYMLYIAYIFYIARRRP